MLLPVQRAKQKKNNNNALGIDIKRLEIHFYNFPNTSHLKVIFCAFKKTAKYFGNKSEFFCFGGKVTNVWVTIQYNTIQ